MRRLLAIAALAAVLAAPAAAPAAESELQRAQEVLDERMTALRTDDRARWMATVDPAAPPAFAEAQGRQFDGLRRLPLASFRLEARTEETGDLDPAPGRFLPEVRQRYRLSGYDDRDAVDVQWLTFVERGGRFVVASDSDVSPLGLDSARNLWDGGPVDALATDHFLVLHDPAQASRARAVAAICEEALERLRRHWRRPWSERIPVVLPRSVEELEALLQSTIDLDKYVAFVGYGVLRDGGWEPTAPRIYIQDRNLAANPRASQVETLVHELVHAASVPLAGPQLRVWLHEGVADWVAGGRPGRERPPSGSDGRLPRDEEFVTGSSASIVGAYRESRSFVSFLAARNGVDAPIDVFAAVGAAKVAPGDPDHHADAALRAVTGAGLGDLEAAWRRR